MTTNDVLTTLEKITGRRLTLGSAVWALRTTEEISQVAFAKKLGVSKQYLCDLDHDRKSVSPKQAEKFADCLDTQKSPLCSYVCKISWIMIILRLRLPFNK